MRISDWRSDVCSSDLRIELAALHRARQTAEEGACATGDKAGEGEDDDLHGADPHAEGGGRELARAHGGELQAETAEADHAHHDGEDKEHARASHTARPTHAQTTGRASRRERV